MNKQTNTLAVLIVEDVESDVQLLMRQLKKAGRELVYEQVETAAQMRAALKKQSWNIVISDYSLPQFDGQAALAILKETGLDIPFIIVSGTVGEETAVAMMKAGAQDYLMKSDLARLVPAVERELEQAQVRRERRQAEQALAESESELRALFASMQDVVMVIDRRGLYCKIAPTNPGLLVKPAAELLGMNLRDVFPAEQAEVFIAVIKYVLDVKQTAHVEYELLVEGKTVYFETSISPMEEDNTLWVARDISERKQAEERLRESEEKHRAFIEQSAEGIMLVNEVGNIIEWNHAREALSGLKSEDVLGKPYWDIRWQLSPPDMQTAGALQRFKSTTFEMLSGQSPLFNRVNEGRLVTISGEIKNVEQVAFPIKTKNGYCVGSVMRDITARKQAEDALLESEARYRRLADHAPDIIFRYDIQPIMKLTYISPAVQSITGYSPQECYDDSLLMLNMMHPDDMYLMANYMQSLIPPKEPLFARWIGKDGVTRWMESRIVPVKDADGQLIAVEGITRDITGRKQAEEALRESEDRYRTLVEFSPDGIGIHCEGKIIYVNAATVKLLHANSPQDLIGMEAIQFVHPNDRDIVMDRVRRGYENHAAVPLLVEKFITLDRQMIDVEVSATPIVYNGKKATQIIMRDVTQRRQTEEALAASESELRALVEQVPTTIYTESAETRQTLYISPQVEKLTGFTSAEWVEDHDLWKKIIHPADVDAIVEENDRTSKSYQPFSVEYRILTRDGRTLWVHDEAVIIQNQDGTPLFWQGVMYDITERKQTEEALATSESELRAMVEQVPATVYTDSAESRAPLYVSPQIEKLTGYTPAEWIEDHDLWKKVIHPADVDAVVEENNRTSLSHDPLSVEYRILTRDGRTLWIHDESVMIQNQDGTPLFWQGVMYDITGRRQAEEALRESQSLYHSLVESSPLSICRKDPEGRFTFANRRFLELSNITLADLLGKTDFDLHPSELAEKYRHDDQSILDSGQVRELIEERTIHGDETTFVQSIKTPIYDGSGKINGIQISFWDITERKRAEKLAAQQGEQLRLLYETSQRLNRTLDLDEIYQVICDFMSTIAPNDGVIISAFDHETQLITCRAYWLEDGWLDVSPFPSIPLEAEGKGTQSRVIRSGQAMLINDYEAYQKTASTVYYVNGETNEVNQEVLPEEDITRSALIVPLKSGGKVSGVIQVMSYRLNAYTENQLKLLEALALHIASAEQNALLYARVQTELNERKQAEKSLRESEEQYRTLVEQLPAIVFIDDASVMGRTLYISPQIETILGFPQQEWLDKSPRIWKTQVHPDDLERVHAGYIRCFLNGEPHDAEYRIRAADGRMIWLRDQAVRLTDENGKPHLIHGVMYDITERKQSEEAIRRRVTELEMLYQSGLVLGQLLSPKEVGQKILELLEEKLNWHHTRIRLYHSQDDSLELLDFNQPGLNGEVERGEAVDRFQSLIAHSNQGMSGWVIQQGQSARSGDVSSDPRYVEAYPGIHSGLYVPMKLGERVVGVISIEDEQPHAFSEADERLIATLANQAASAFENARLFEETRQRVMELETLNRISLVLRAVTKQNEMLSIVLDEGLAILNTSHGSIELHNKTTDLLEQTILRGWIAQVTNPHHINEGIAGKVFTSGEVYISREFASDPETRPAARSHIPPGWGGICLPIRTTQQTLGVMVVSIPSERELNKNEIRLLSILSEMTGAALQRMQLHEQTVRRLEQLKSLRAVDQAISSSRDMRLTLSVLLTHTISQPGVDAADVLLLHPGSNLLELVDSRGFHLPLPEKVRLNDSFVLHAIMEHRLISAHDFEIVDKNPHFWKLWKAENFVCYWCVPLIVKGEVKGVLEVYCRKPFTPDAEWLEFLEALAGQAAIAIDTAQLFENLQHANMDLSLAYDATIEGWSRAMDLRDHETEGHTLRVTDLTMKLARAMRVSESQLTAIRRGALLHDIGKMGVPDAILLKEGDLTDEEWVLMRKHPEFARDMLMPITYLNDALNIPYCHHEKWDGTGYPQELKGDQIPLVARIFAVVDVWDALTNDRTYRTKWTKQKARQYIKEQSGKHFDPQVVDVFLNQVEND